MIVYLIIVRENNEQTSEERDSAKELQVFNKGSSSGESIIEVLVSGIVVLCCALSNLPMKNPCIAN